MSVSSKSSNNNSLSQVRESLKNVDFVIQYEWAISVLSENLKVLKASKKEESKKAKKEKKLDDDGNEIKNDIPAQFKPWKLYSTHIFTKLFDITHGKIVPKDANRISKLMKDAGHYPIEKLEDSVIEDTYNEWFALPKELRFPKKNKDSSSDSDSIIDSDLDTHNQTFHEVKVLEEPVIIQKVIEPLPLQPKKERKVSKKEKKSE